MEEEKTEDKKESSHIPDKEESKNNLPKEIKDISKKADFTKKIRTNPWIISTFILGIIVLILLIGNSFGGITGNVISSTVAGEKLLSYYTENGASDLEIDSIKEISGLYQINFKYQETIIPVYITKDGKYAGSLSTLPEQTSTSTSTSSTEIPTSDKPKTELFIWSYCPYGVQALAPFAEVVKLLENKADFEVILYYDGHGDYETQQNKIQACIQEKAKNKYWDYAIKFAEEIYPKCGVSRDIECDKTESINLMNSLGIDSSAVMSCVESQGNALLSEHSAKAKEVGVTGSPSLVINDVKANPSSRTAEAFKDSICSAFNDIPQECSTELDSATATASGNC